MKRKGERSEEIRVDQFDFSQVSSGLPESGALNDFEV